MVSVEKIKQSHICYDKYPSIHIQEYHDYCLSILKNVLSEIDISINIIFGDVIHYFNNDNKTLKIGIQYEHTLVLEGGRGINNKIFGNVKNLNGDNYLVRIDRFEHLNNLDLIIEYSNSNFFNISSSKKFDSFLEKIVVISPSIYPKSLYRQNKKNTISIFSENNSNRRDIFLRNISNQKINHTNINNCFNFECLKKLYDDTKILINVHQTDHHHTLEELRVLPALYRGVIVISENVPLMEQIPYHEYIIWSDYNSIIEKIIEVQNNYELFYREIFTDRLNNILDKITVENVKNMKEKIIKKIL